MFKYAVQNKRYNQLGQETLQSILVVAFVLLPILVSIITFGSLIHIYIGAQAAAAAGARDAGIAGGFGPEQYVQVQQELTTNGIEAHNCTIGADHTSVELGQPIHVTVSCPQHIGIPFLLERDVSLSSTFAGRGEVNQ